ncbi:MAG: DNA-processing protein DprA [Phototrophicales bacterium]|nr:DNA-processing protein DprA [Phototrophicales bacterium]
MNERYYWLGFNLISSMGVKRIEHLIAQFGTLQHVWNADEKSLKSAKLADKFIEKLLSQRKMLNLQAEYDKLNKLNIQFVIFSDDDYPTRLRNIPDPPPALYIRGDLLPKDSKALAVVGTRKCTRYGRDVSAELSEQLAKNGVTIISGLAEGIDASAHQGALKGGGRTLAICGCGLDRVYPAQHTALAKKIAENGALISEFSLGTPPIGENFPRRNRIISGLSLGVLVIEAPEKSGALITASVAAEQGREVFVIPGNITNNVASGTNKLLQDGAKLVTSAKDILDELNLEHTILQTRIKTESFVPSSDEEALILKFISTDPTHIDDIIRQTGLNSSEVMGLLTILELKGLAQSAGYMQYSLVT